MLTVDKPAFMRVTGLLRAFNDDDRTNWEAILDSDTNTTTDSPYRTFCAMTAFADRALDWLTHETGRDRDDLLTRFQHAFCDLLDQQDTGEAGTA